MIWSKKALRLKESPINWLIQYALESPKTISLAAGLVEQESLPVKELEEAFQSLLREENCQRFLQYGATSGLKELKISTIDWLQNLDANDSSFNDVSEDSIVITNGCQQLLYLLSEVLFDQGDIVIVESPSYFVYTDALKSIGVQFIGIPMTPEGMDISILKSTLISLDENKQLNRLKMIYSIPWCQNPTGVSRSPQNLKDLHKLLSLYLDKSEFYFVEDAAYRALVFDGSTVSGSMLEYKNMVPRTIFATTFSKPFAPGVKLGAGIVPEPIKEKLVLVKGNHDFGSSHWNQALVWQLLKNGGLEVARKRVLKSYQQKSALLFDLLSEQLPSSYELEKVSGGMYLWLKCPSGIDTGRDSELFKNCLENGVIYVPGEYCDIDEKNSKNSIRFSFGRVTHEEIVEGVSRFILALSKSRLSS